MEDQPTIISEYPQTHVPDKVEPSQEPVTKTEVKIPEGLNEMFKRVFSNIGAEMPPPVQTEKPPKEKEESEVKTGLDLGEIMSLVQSITPLLASILGSRSSAIPERGTGFRGPTFRKSRTSSSEDSSLLVQIIIGKFSFLVTRSGEDKYVVAFRRETIFQKKLLSAKGLYTLIKNFADNGGSTVHFGLIGNDETLENKVIEVVDKKILKKTIRYFLCMIWGSRVR